MQTRTGRTAMVLLCAATLLPACGDDAGSRPATLAVALGSNRVTNMALQAALDSSGNVYVVGRARSALFGSAKSGNSYGGFLASYTPQGAVRWGTQLNTYEADVALTTVTVDGAQVFAAGTTTGPVGGRPIPDRQDGFIVGYTRTGAPQWLEIVAAAVVGPTSGVTVSDMAAGGGGTLYVAGSATAGVSFGNRTGERIGATDGFIVALTTGGAPAGDIIVLGAPGEVTVITGVAADPAGDLYACGYTSAPLSGQRLTGTLDAFVVKYTRSGALQWVSLFGAPQATTIAADLSYSARNGALYVGGYSTRSQSGQASAGSRLPYVASYAAATGARNWLREAAGTTRRSETLAVAADPQGNVYAAGYTESDMYWPTYASFHDATLAKFDPSGRLIGGTQFGTNGDSAAACFWGLVQGGNRVIVVGSSSFGLDPDAPEPGAGGTFAIVKSYREGGIGQ